MSDEAGSKRRSLRVPSFVGREQARRGLAAALERALKFEAPQFVTVLAPLGMGKSRLLAEWSAGVEAAGVFRVVRAATAPLVRDGEIESFALLAAVLRARFGVDAGADAATTMAAFRRELEQVFGDRRVAEVA